MMTTYELRSLLRGEMANAGFVRHAGGWTRKAGDLLWIVQLDRSPYGQRFSIDIGVALIGDSGEPVPTEANDCPILMHLENLPLTGGRQIRDARFNDFRTTVIIGFDLTSDIEDEERRQLISS